MSVLPPDALDGLRAGLSASMNVQTVAYKVVTDGVAGSPVNLRALVSATNHGPTQDANGNRVEIAIVISVRPLEDESLVFGDIVTYLGRDYVIQNTSGTDVRTLSAAYRENIGWQRTDRFRAEGG